MKTQLQCLGAREWSSKLPDIEIERGKEPSEKKNHRTRIGMRRESRDLMSVASLVSDSVAERVPDLTETTKEGH
jgi:hypothetical protein